MEITYPKLALCGREKLCAKAATVFFPICEVSKGTVSLLKPEVYMCSVLEGINRVKPCRKPKSVQLEETDIRGKLGRKSI